MEDPAAAARGGHAQVARQPIFDEQMQVAAYELLFRSEIGATAADDPTASTNRVLSASLFGIGADRLTGDKVGFVNCPRNLIVGGYEQLLSPAVTAIEILPSVAPDLEVADGCRRFKAAGFTIAIDGLRPGDPRKVLLPFADIVKIDFLETTQEERQAVARMCAGKPITLLGTRLESPEDVAEARELGCTLFQGYFFARPETVSGKEVPGNKLTQLRIMSQVTRPEISLLEVEDLIKQDVSLSVKLLKYINSAAFGWKHQIQTIHQALVMLGQREIRKWITLVSMTSLGSDRPLELAVKSVIRGRMCELLAPALKAEDRAADLFFLGILSHLDALLSRPMEEALTDIHLADDVRATLLSQGGATLPGAALAITEAYERADWDLFSAVCGRLGVSEAAAPGAYLSAVEFGNALVTV